MQEQQKQQPAPFRSCVHGCYTLQYDNALESGGPGWFPLEWRGEAWRAQVQVGFFELVVLRFPTYQEALDWIYQQP